jgi:ABC-type polysaccharide/polyol phosphate transport system ATPase subunit
MLSGTGLSKSFQYNASHSVFQDFVLRRPLQAGRKRLDVLRNATLEVSRGEWVGLFGPNGAGKTTLLRILGELMPPDRGAVRCHGTMALFLGLGVGFNMELAAEQNIYLDGLLHGFNKRQTREHTERVIEFAGLESHREMPLKYYSTGMQLRLAYAAAAQYDMDIYLFDEVMSVGDTDFQARCMDHLRSLRARGKTAVLVGHSLPQLRMLCDRVETLRDGVIEPLPMPVPAPASVAAPVPSHALAR